ncbi:hypothetical protein UFOVP459_33 [uncultured Caudovirales phage]|uniref:Uncharacterized protein n=1 Tax=uncultured Caudovirales phage TaxID=2100421 RepID=A0A6J5MH01_9CAUD|nr:hypothetical protein UFOVP459_33 [uncultured Caudovirales phage]CAB4183335.1 hypothetical protein UFOVP1089_52 [uncultured Caudovirales phage]CAB4213095.1 hypothetical protein UFOVP1443_71 [uncultured Caudovirales phage]
MIKRTKDRDIKILQMFIDLIDRNDPDHKNAIYKISKAFNLSATRARDIVGNLIFDVSKEFIDSLERDENISFPNFLWIQKNKEKYVNEIEIYIEKNGIKRNKNVCL